MIESEGSDHYKAFADYLDQDSKSYQRTCHEDVNQESDFAFF